MTKKSLVPSENENKAHNKNMRHLLVSFQSFKEESCSFSHEVSSEEDFQCCIHINQLRTCFVAHQLLGKIGSRLCSR